MLPSETSSMTDAAGEGEDTSAGTADSLSDTDSGFFSGISDLSITMWATSSSVVFASNTTLLLASVLFPLLVLL